jgi:hypothetical protein
MHLLPPLHAAHLTAHRHFYEYFEYFGLGTVDGPSRQPPSLVEGGESTRGDAR